MLISSTIIIGLDQFTACDTDFLLQPEIFFSEAFAATKINNDWLLRLEDTNDLDLLTKSFDYYCLVYRTGKSDPIGYIHENLADVIVALI